jgi:hypothetical protein
MQTRFTRQLNCISVGWSLGPSHPQTPREGCTLVASLEPALLVDSRTITGCLMR